MTSADNDDFARAYSRENEYGLFNRYYEAAARGWADLLAPPLHAMTDAFAAAGLRIHTVSEPPLAPDTPQELLPPGLEERRSFMRLLFFVLEAV
ncbi:hypothetical protein ACT8ZV_19335 [Nocardioides sp. MAHUQ-72]|uniref:hypothetical protein n=1 Tax=unclassified Nocardioides TaxID=2615069 RepID=UPI00361BA695